MAKKPGMISGAVTLVVLAAVIIYVLTDNVLVSNICYLGVMVGAAVGAWIGAERAAHGSRLVPRLIALGISLTALGDVLWNVLDLMGADTDVSIADPPWFASYVALGLALCVVLAQSQSQSQGQGQHARRRGDVDFVIDAVTIVVVSVLIFWSFAVDAIIADQTLTPIVRAVWSAYPVADAVLLALVLRVLMTRSTRTTMDGAFVVGVCLWLAADLAALNTPEGSAVVAMDVAWMVAPVLMARAAWRVRDVSPDTTTAPADEAWGPQVVVAVVPLMVPPALVLAADLGGEPAQPLQLFIGTAALVALAFVRTARLIWSEGRARHALEVARDAALGASYAKSMFLANVSHEIRTPLTTVLATGEILEDTPLDDHQRRLLAKMHRSGELLRRLVEEILDFSRIEAGRLELASAAFDLHALVADTADVYESRATKAGIRFECDLDQCVPQSVIGDSGRLFQVLSNLLDNAVKFTHQGQVNLTVRPADVTGEQSTATTVEFVVSDTGIGIREEDQTSVFESFNQVDGSVTRRYGGSGLGLAICQELTQLMGGSLTVQSQFGAGTAFVVRLPMVHAARDRAGQL